MEPVLEPEGGGLFHSARLLCKASTGGCRRGVLFAGGLLKVRRLWQPLRISTGKGGKDQGPLFRGVEKILNAFPDLLLLLDGGKVLDFQAGEKAPLPILHEGVQGKLCQNSSPFDSDSLGP